MILVRHEQRIPDQLEHRIGKGSLSLSQFKSAPPWLIQNAMNAEVFEAWNDAYETTSESSVPHKVNIIGSHFIFQNKNKRERSQEVQSLPLLSR